MQTKCQVSFVFCELLQCRTVTKKSLSRVTGRKAVFAIIYVHNASTFTGMYKHIHFVDFRICTHGGFQTILFKVLYSLVSF